MYKKYVLILEVVQEIFFFFYFTQFYFYFLY